MSNNHYSLQNLPTSDSEIVHQERNKMIDAVQIKCLADHLKQVEIIVRLASNAASGSGDADLYLQVRGLQTQMKDVYGDCAQAASQFTSSTASVISNLQFAFDMLLQAQEQVAADIFSGSYSVAEKAQKKAEKLAEDIKQASKKIEEVIKINKEKQEDAEKAKKQIEEELDGIVKLTVDYLKHGDSIKNLTKEYESATSEVKDKENKRAKKLVGFWSTLFATAGPTESDIDRAENRRREKQETLEKTKEAQKELGNKVFEQLAKLDENKDNWREIGKGVTLECLENVSKGLAEISATLGGAAIFWGQIAQRCEYLSQDKTKDILNSMLRSMSEEKRKECYAMASFQKQATKYYAQWVALHDVSFDFGRQICSAQTGVLCALAEAPTRKEGIMNAKEIAKQIITPEEIEKQLTEPASRTPSSTKGIINAKEIVEQLSEPQD